MTRFFCLIPALSLLPFYTPAQDTVPLLKGRVEFSITQGTIECHWVMTQIPRLEDYTIRINSGMNPRYFKKGENGYPLNFEWDLQDTLSTGETKAYYFLSNRKKFLPDTIEFSYTGRYPVFYDSLKDYSGVDWKGNLSFNGYSLRVDGTQSGWYPVLYDVKKDKKYAEVRYDLEINCSDCSTLYINGNAPVYASKARFSSNIPREMMLYCGNYRYSNVDGTYILNPDLTEEETRQFAKITNSYKQFLERKLNIPYGDQVTYIRTTPSSEFNGWLFVSYPTIANINHKAGLKQFLDPKTSDWFKPFIAHEIGHYYFGTLRDFNTELGDMINEGFAEYLSFKITQHLIGDSVYRKKIAEKARAIARFDAIPMGRIKSHPDYQDRELYVYYYAPLIFTAIEKEIGEKKMWEWIRSLLTTKAEFTNYGFLTGTLDAVVKDPVQSALIRSKYFQSEKALGNLLETLGLQ
ncbi:MAG: hypothetical protein HYZ15_07000 [Sphingobacteriales bacterium]|nr:hypothetical protein [Sphingobacteriales bacterium]